MCTDIQQTAAPQNSHLADLRQPACDAGWRGPADLVKLGLSVSVTLYLVGDNQKRYNMFGKTFVKFPGRKASRPHRFGVS